jgi:hypothetical protein
MYVEVSSQYDATMQNFIYKHTLGLENVQRNKRKEKGEFTRHQVSSNYISKSSSQKPTTYNRSIVFFHVKNQLHKVGWPW